MFKAKMIESDDFYKLRTKIIWLSLIPGIPIFLLVDYKILNPLLTTIIVILYSSGLLWLYFLNQKKKNLIGKKHIEISAEEILIKSSNKSQLESYLVTKIDKIIVDPEYTIPLDSMKAQWSEIQGKHQRQSLTIEQQGNHQKFEFEIDSYYMIEQLNKIINQWQNRGLKVVTL